MNQINFESITKNNINEVCKLHRIAYLEDHFSSHFSDDMLKHYYLELIKGNEQFCLIAFDPDGQAVGFVISGLDLNNNVKKFVNQNIFAISKITFFNPKFIYPKIKSLFTRFSKERWQSKADYRVLSIAVNPSYQGEGIGRLILKEIETRYKFNKINKYGLSVKKSNYKATAFYVKLGFNLEHYDKKSAYYIKDIL